MRGKPKTARTYTLPPTVVSFGRLWDFNNAAHYVPTRRHEVPTPEVQHAEVIIVLRRCFGGKEGGGGKERAGGRARRPRLT